ncbi:hypothetical protein C0J52_02968 [Blattella germanica]|nr:hypothetical protein C0J52_02968 [Blattella germanica]
MSCRQRRSYSARPSLHLRRALVLSKMTRYELEAERYSDLDRTAQDEILRRQVSDFDVLLQHHKINKEFESSVVKALNESGIETRTVSRADYTEQNINWADVVIPVGGDGTFLMAASRVWGNEKPVVGFNSDPSRSEGYLCLPVKYSTNIKEAIAKIQRGEFKWQFRARIRITLEGTNVDDIERVEHYLPESEETKTESQRVSSVILPVLALNEVFMGESLSSRVSYLGLSIDGGVYTKVKSSGICVSTGSGSTSWHLSINRITEQSVSEVVKLLGCEDACVKEIADQFNRNLVFGHDENRMSYTVRDLISAGVWPDPKGLKPRGFAKRIEVTSRCFDGGLVVDGGVFFGFNGGSKAILEIHEADSLRSIQLYFFFPLAPFAKSSVLYRLLKLGTLNKLIECQYTIYVYVQYCSVSLFPRKCRYRKFSARCLFIYLFYNKTKLKVTTMFRFHGPVKAMDDYLIPQLIYEQVVVFVCSTTGQGEEPDNMKKFWRFLLRKNLPADSLKGMRYAVLGLGDSSYVYFNYAAKKLHRRLLQLGAQPFLELGLADDQHDLGADAVVDPWVVQMSRKLCVLFPLPQENGTDFGAETQNSKDGRFTQNNPYYGVVKNNVRTTSPSHFQDVRLIKMEAPGLEYHPGDVVMISPCNAPDKVDHFFSMLNRNRIDPEFVVQVLEKDSDAPVPLALQNPISLRKCAEQYWDLNVVPRRHFFHLLSFFTTSELEKEKLIEFTTPEGQEELYNYCNRPRRTVLEVLQDFPHSTANIDVEHLFELLQPIRPRAFSIASSPQAHKGEIHVLVAIVKYRTKLVTPRLGLCSNWLASLEPGAKIPIWIKNGSFRFPPAQNVPVVMIGPGTGVAPFRSYVNERVAGGEASDKLLLLFFGCRNRDADFHCSDEWLELQRLQKLSLFCAFSRDQEHKIYVQHVIKEQATLLWTLLSSSGAWIFLAGSSKNMPAGVKEALTTDVVAKAGGLGQEEAELYIKNLEQSGRFQSETWS